MLKKVSKLLLIQNILYIFSYDHKIFLFNISLNKFIKEIDSIDILDSIFDNNKFYVLGKKIFLVYDKEMKIKKELFLEGTCLRINCDSNFIFICTLSGHVHVLNMNYEIKTIKISKDPLWAITNSQDFIYTAGESKFLYQICKNSYAVKKIRIEGMACALNFNKMIFVCDYSRFVSVIDEKEFEKQEIFEVQINKNEFEELNKFNRTLQEKPEIKINQKISQEYINQSENKFGSDSNHAHVKDLSSTKTTELKINKNLIDILQIRKNKKLQKNISSPNLNKLFPNIMIPSKTDIKISTWEFIFFKNFLIMPCMYDGILVFRKNNNNFNFYKYLEKNDELIYSCVINDNKIYYCDFNGEKLFIEEDIFDENDVKNF